MRRLIKCGWLCVAWVSFGRTSWAQETNGSAAFPSASAAAPAAAPPVQSASPAPAPVTSVARDSGSVSFVASPGVAFYQLDDEGGKATRICLAPCVANLSGRQKFALTLEGGKPLEAPESLAVSSGDRVEGEYRDNSGWRQTGWIVLGLGVTGGITVIASGMGVASTGGSSARTTGAAMIGGGAAATVISLVAGLALVFTGDEVHVHALSP